MPERRATSSRTLLAAAIAALVLAAGPAGAHKVNLFAEADGATVRGEAYFTGGGRPRNVVVQVVGPAAEALGETRTDDAGRFTFTATRRCDHTFVIDTGDGHLAKFTVEAAELPASLPGPRIGARPARAQPTRPSTTAPSEAVPALGEANDALAEVVARAVRRELRARDQDVRVRDVIAGIGYIVGLAGLASLLLRRKRDRAG